MHCALLTSVADTERPPKDAPAHYKRGQTQKTPNPSRPLGETVGPKGQLPARQAHLAPTEEGRDLGLQLQAIENITPGGDITAATKGQDINNTTAVKSQNH